MNNRRLYIDLKYKIAGSRYMCKNLPMSFYNTVCSKCGKKYDYRYAPIVVDDVYLKCAGRLGKMACLCANCMERANGGKFNIAQLKPCQISINYAFCNDLDVDCEGAEEVLMQMHKVVDRLIDEYENIDESQWNKKQYK